MTIQRKTKINFNLNEQDMKVLPHDEVMERAVLATLTTYPEAYNVGRKYLNAPGLFYNELHSEIWERMKEIADNGSAISWERLATQYRASGDRNNAAYCEGLGQVLPYWRSAKTFEKDCLKLNEYWFSRNLNRLGFFLNQESLNPAHDALELLGKASVGMDKMYQHIAQMKESTIEDAIGHFYKEIILASKSQSGLIGLPSTLTGVNDRIKGYRNGNLIVVGASTGEGKTTLAVQDARSIAGKQVGVGYVSLEMSYSDLLLMMACDEIRLDASKVMAGELTPQQSNDLSRYMEFLKTLPLKISEQPGLKISEIKALARMWKKNNDIKILFIDHLHLAYDDVDHGSNSEQRFTNVANKLKELAKELDIPVVALAQLSRRDKQEKNRPHVISDLKYAGGIEQAADVVMLIYRQEIHEKTRVEDHDPIHGLAVIQIVKLRLIKAKDVVCKFIGTRFTDNYDFTPEPKAYSPALTNAKPADDDMPF